MLISDDQLRTIILGTELVEPGKFDELVDQAQASKIPLSRLLISSGYISEDNLWQVIADVTRIPFVVLSKVAIPEEILRVIPEVVARKQRIIAFKKDRKGLHVAMGDPTSTTSEQLLKFLEKKIGMPIIAYLATERDINAAQMLYGKKMSEVFNEIVAEDIKKSKLAKAVKHSTIKIVNAILMYAHLNSASDIHIEPEEIYSLVRFRIDGVLHDIVTLPVELHPQIVTRIKILSKLRTDEHQAAQDGKLQWNTGQMTSESLDLTEEEKSKTRGERLDVRVSIVPVTEGEKIVMRLLSERSRQFSFSDIGFSENDLKKVNDAYRKPYGLILSTGPTGCGKTTTLYSILKLLNKRDVNIMTIEDPVEYDIEGINQIQVNPKTNLTFSAGLRSIVRQDPDIIFVGEVRDEETASISINSAMTGHLVLSSLHTNDAATAIPRFLDMGIEPFLVASTVNLIIAQRLVRKICTKCRVSMEVKLESAQLGGLPVDLVKKQFGSKEKIRIYKGKGCGVCHDSGYIGRVGIFEVLSVDDEIKAAIVERKDSGVIRKIAIKNGMSTIIEDGLKKIKEGTTTVEEVIRVTKE